MKPRLRTVAACHRAAAEQFRRVSTPDLSVFERGEFALARKHLASLSPERRAEIDQEWK